MQFALHFGLPFPGALWGSILGNASSRWVRVCTALALELQSCLDEEEALLAWHPKP